MAVDSCYANLTVEYDFREGFTWKGELVFKYRKNME